MDGWIVMDRPRIQLAAVLFGAPLGLPVSAFQGPPASVPILEQPVQPDSVPAIEELPPAYETVFEQAVSEVEEWYGAERLPAQWRRQVEQVRAGLAGAISERGFLELLNPLLYAVTEPRPILLPPEASRFRPGIAVSVEPDRALILQVDPTSHAWRLGIRRGDELLQDAASLAGASGSRVELRLRTQGGLVRRLEVERDGAGDRPWSPELYADPARAPVLRPAEGGSESLSELLATVAAEGELEIDLRSSTGDPAGLGILAGWLGLAPDRKLEIRSWNWKPAEGESSESGGLESPQSIPWPDANLKSTLAAALERHSRLSIAPQRLERRRRGKSRVLVDGGTCGSAEAWARLLKAGGIAVYGSPTCGRPTLDTRRGLSGGWSLLLPLALLGESGPPTPVAPAPTR